ncbi:kinase-like protein [Aspergillus niger ATCC 13496]|uniref:non-specific serine/threonine protein kinase n=3 Tax=Aspergillus niger TaxID=5061 RepID=A2QVC9_ASPNC|nr:uncharacterized protein An11g00950 [Aspergillus niger]RDH15836.1 kinase-like protein [Aspergillus niger ATCC 13496]CAK96886.1 unnamed protein product [Aspergillus niger]
MEPRRHFYRLYKHCHLSFCRPKFSSIARISSKVAYSRRCAHTTTLSQKPRVFPGSGWENIDPSVLIEEESIPTYKPEKFYPVRIGEIFNHRYQVVGKLGYGSTATVWLCRDLLPVMSAAVVETFQILNPDGHRIHTCLVHPPLGISLDQLTSLLPGKVMSSSMVRTTMRNILAALDFLHTEAQVIHTAEVEAPVPRKSLSDRIIYVSRPLPISFGTPVLCDLGEGRLGTENQQGDIMPDIYRAPEVIMNMKWDKKVDIWNVGMVPKIWDLFERRHLFKARNDEGKLDDGQHLAEMQAVLGMPPAQFLARSERSHQFWDANGAVPTPDYDLETLEERLEDGEKEDFLRFLRRMLCWLPEERATAKELLFDPWLMHGLFR